MHIPEGYKLVPVELLGRVRAAIINTSQMHPALGDLEAILATPVPPQVEAQPVAWTVKGPDGGICQEYATCFYDEADAWPKTLVEGYTVVPLFTHSDGGVANSNHKLLMDGACGEIALLEQDVESVKSKFNRLNDLYYECQKERDTLRAQLESLPETLIAAIEAEQERLSAEDYLMDSEECIEVMREALSATKEGKSDA